MTGNGGMRFGKLTTGAEMRDGIEDWCPDDESYTFSKKMAFSGDYRFI